MSWFSRATRRLMRTRWDDESGFTLVEAIAALVIAALVFAAVAAAAMTGIKASVSSRLNQQAGDIVNRAVEDARGLSYAALTMVSTDLQTNDNTISTGASPQWQVPSGALEKVDVHTTGAISPHVTSITANVNHATFTVKRYVTVPSTATYDANGFPSMKRFTAVVTWSVYRQLHTRVSTTLVTDTVRGLPLPNYTLRSVGPTATTVAANVVVDFGFALHNLGARDAFNVTVSSPTNTGSLVAAWAFYVDNGVLDPAASCSGMPAPVAGDGVHQCGEGSLLPDTDGNGQPDTGYIDTSGNYNVVAEHTSTSADTGSVQFTTTSIAQPTATGATHSKTYTVTITTGTVGGGSTCPTLSTATQGSGTTLVAFYADQAAASASTTVGNLARSDCTVNQGATAPNYSTDVAGNTEGRSLAAIGTGTFTTTAAGPTMAMWSYQPASATTVNGSGSIRLWVQCQSSTATPTITVGVGPQNKATSIGSFVNSETGSAKITSGCPTTGYLQVDIPLALKNGAWTVGSGNTKVMGVHIYSDTNVRLMYDYGSYISYLVLSVNP